MIIIKFFILSIDIFGTSEAPSNQCSEFIQVLQVTGFCSPMIVQPFTILAACGNGIDIMAMIRLRIRRIV